MGDFTGSYEFESSFGNGILNVEKCGVYYLFKADCPVSPQAVHMWCRGPGGDINAGVPLPRDGRMYLEKKLSTAALRPLGGGIDEVFLLDSGRKPPEKTAAVSLSQDNETSQKSAAVLAETIFEPKASEAAKDSAASGGIEAVAEQPASEAAVLAGAAPDDGLSDTEPISAAATAEPPISDELMSTLRRLMSGDADASRAVGSGFQSQPEADDNVQPETADDVALISPPPVPPGWKSVSDGIYRGVARSCGAITRIERGSTVVAIPVLPDRPFPVTGLMAAGVPVRLGEYQYLLFAAAGGELREM